MVERDRSGEAVAAGEVDLTGAELGQTIAAGDLGVDRTGDAAGAIDESLIGSEGQGAGKGDRGHRRGGGLNRAEGGRGVEEDATADIACTAAEGDGVIGRRRDDVLADAHRVERRVVRQRERAAESHRSHGRGRGIADRDRGGRLGRDGRARRDASAADRAAHDDVRGIRYPSKAGGTAGSSCGANLGVHIDHITRDDGCGGVSAERGVAVTDLTRSWRCRADEGLEARIGDAQGVRRAVSQVGVGRAVHHPHGGDAATRDAGTVGSGARSGDSTGDEEAIK